MATTLDTAVEAIRPSPSLLYSVLASELGVNHNLPSSTLKGKLTLILGGFFGFIATTPTLLGLCAIVMASQRNTWLF